MSVHTINGRCKVLRMKMVCLLASICLTLASPLAAQGALAGIAGGAVNSDFRNANTSSKWGATAGVFGAFRANRNIIVTLEGNWTQKGASNTRINYIEVPLMFGAVLPMDNGMGFRLYAGAELDFKVACSSSDVVFNCDAANGTLFTIPFGVLIGKTSRSGTFVGLDIRYAASLTDTFSNIPSLWNRTWYFRLLIGKGPGR
jgi:hypothetical protein